MLVVMLVLDVLLVLPEMLVVMLVLDVLLVLPEMLVVMLVQDVLLVLPEMLVVMSVTGRPVGTTREQGGGTNYIEDDAQKLCDHLSQYPDLTRKWNTDGASISISNELLNRGKRRIGQQVTF